MKYPWSTTSSSESLSPEMMPHTTSIDKDSIPSKEEKNTHVRTEILDAATPEPEFDRTSRTLKVCCCALMMLTLRVDGEACGYPEPTCTVHWHRR